MILLHSVEMALALGIVDILVYLPAGDFIYNTERMRLDEDGF